MTDQFPLNCKFPNVSFSVKTRETGQPVIRGHRKVNLYVLFSPLELHFSNHFRLGSMNIWHQRLGHQQASALRLLQNKALIEVAGSNKAQSFCDSCQLRKLNRSLTFLFI